MARQFFLFLVLIVLVASTQAAFSWFGTQSSSPVVVKGDSWDDFKAKFDVKTAGKTVTSSVTEVPCNGVEGLGVKLNIPWKLGSGFVAGIKYNVERILKFPDEVYIRKSWETSEDGTWTVEADYKYADDSFGLAAEWASDKIGLTLHASGDTNNYNFINEVGCQIKEVLDSSKLSLDGTYDFVKNKFTGNALLDCTSSFSARLTGDSIAVDPVLALSYDLDEKNTVSPAVSLRYGDSSYAWTRKINGGSVKATLYPNDKYNIVWKDEGTDGEWTAKIEVPIDNMGVSGRTSKFSITRDWTY